MNNENPNLGAINKDEPLVPIANNLEDTSMNLGAVNAAPIMTPEIEDPALKAVETTPVVEPPVMETTPVEVTSEIPSMEVADATATIETVDPTANIETVDPTISVESVNPTVEVPTDAVTNTVVEPTPLDAANAPVVGETVNPTTEAPKTRYNPVTGEEEVINDLGRGKPTEMPDITPKVEEPVKPQPEAKEVTYKPTSKGNTILLVVFFIFLIIFIVFLPDIQNLIALRNAPKAEVEDIKTGQLVCTIESSTVNLDREITRVFKFTDNKLQSAKFTTYIRGDATKDEEVLNELAAQCNTIKDNVKDLSGITVSCTHEEGSLTETESFDYDSYNAEEVSAAYTEAGGSVLEFEKDQDIELIMSNMRQGGFTCNKEK